MPIQAPTTATAPAAKEFSETTAAHRKTGPVKKYPPVSEHIRNKMRDGLGVIAPRVHEITERGGTVSLAAVRASEVAAKIQRGETNITALEMTQSQIAILEALDVGLSDPNSAYYQENTTLRAQRETELKDLRNEIGGYLTQVTRQPYDQTCRRWQLPFVPPRSPNPQRWFRALRHDVTQEVTPPENRPLTPTEITQAESQSRLIESYDQVRMRLTKERYGTKPYGSLRPEEKRLITYSTSDEIARQFSDDRAKEIINEATTHVEKDNINEALENGTPVEKMLAKRAQQIEDDREAFLRKGKDLGKVKTMAEFQRFLRVDNTMLSEAEITNYMIDKLGVFDKNQINWLQTHPDVAFGRFFQEQGPLGTITCVGEMIQGKLGVMAENRGIKPKKGERAPGEPPTDLTADTLMALKPAGIALQLVENKFTDDPVKYLSEQGIAQAPAEQMIKEAEEFAIKNADGSYSINEDKLVDWDNNSLAVLIKRRGVNFLDPVQVTEFTDKFKDNLVKQGEIDPVKQNARIDPKIKELKELLNIDNPTITEAQRKDILKKWDKKSLGILSLLLGPAFMTKVINLMEPNEQRAFNNMFQ